VVHALDHRGLRLIKDAMRSKAPDLQPPFFVAPGANHVHIISDVLKTTSLERILAFFDRAMEFSDPRFTRANIDDLSYLAGYVDEILPFMPVDERLTIAAAPVTLRSDAVLGWFLNAMLPAFSGDAKAEKSLERFFNYVNNFTTKKTGAGALLRDAEDYLRGLTVYAWLSYRYPDVFSRLEDCEARRDIVNAYIERELHSQSAPAPKKRRDHGSRQRSR
jgi:ATP-dependent RNA helicase SUPV3L1/SUV3